MNPTKVNVWALLAVSVALLGSIVLQPGVANAVANGEPVAEGDYRFSVKLTMTGIPTADGGRRDSACSGALIASDWVITAGHCFRDVNGVRVERPVADLTTATVGRADLSGTNGQVATVVAVRQSPTNDVALARLDRPIRGIRPLEFAYRPPQAGDVLRLTGYGWDGVTDPRQPSTILRTGQVTVVSVEQSIIGVTGHAPARDTSACVFDSGAPYFVERFGRPQLVSVESTGPSCPHDDVETTARVDNIFRWVRNSIAR
jgi:secreted trypsin-like serine protease